MSALRFRVLRSGNCTETGWELIDGKSRHTVTKIANGKLSGSSFASQQEARDFCESELKSAPSALFYYVLDGDLVVATILDSAYHQAMERRGRRRYAVISTLVLALVATPLFMLLAPFETLWANAAVVVLVVLFHIAALTVYGTGNFEGAVVTVIVLVLLAVLLPSLKRARELKRELEHRRSLQIAPSGPAATQP